MYIQNIRDEKGIFVDYIAKFPVFMLLHGIRIVNVLKLIDYMQILKCLIHDVTSCHANQISSPLSTENIYITWENYLVLYVHIMSLGKLPSFVCTYNERGKTI